MSNPMLIENIWTLVPDREEAFLTTPWETYRVTREVAELTLRVRSHCTGYNDVAAIAERSGLPEAAVLQVLESLVAAGVVTDDQDHPVDGEAARRGLIAACDLWGKELARDYIGNQFANGRLPRETIVGWLVEMYHYINDFPSVIRHAVLQSVNPELRALLHEYARQETGHEIFVLRTLEGLGLTKEEVIGSTPLVSTRAIGLVMRRLVEIDAGAMLLIAALVEAQDFDEAAIATFTGALQEHYEIPEQVFQPYFQHQEIDHQLGHARLLEDHIDLIDVTNRGRLDLIVNELHDLKHAFDLQAHEIADYYGSLPGRYFPRQPMRFVAIEPRPLVTA